MTLETLAMVALWLVIAWLALPLVVVVLWAVLIAFLWVFTLVTKGPKGRDE